MSLLQLVPSWHGESTSHSIPAGIRSIMELLFCKYLRTLFRYFSPFSAQALASQTELRSQNVSRSLQGVPADKLVFYSCTLVSNCWTHIALRRHQLDRWGLRCNHRRCQDRKGSQLKNKAGLLLKCPVLFEASWQGRILHQYIGNFIYANCSMYSHEYKNISKVYGLLVE